MTMDNWNLRAASAIGESAEMIDLAARARVDDYSRVPRLKVTHTAQSRIYVGRTYTRNCDPNWEHVSDSPEAALWRAVGYYPDLPGREVQRFMASSRVWAKQLIT